MSMLWDRIYQNTQFSRSHEKKNTQKKILTRYTNKQKNHTNGTSRKQKVRWLIQTKPINNYIICKWSKDFK